MTRLPLLLVAPLAACGQPSAPAAPANATSGETGYIARVEALPQGQLRGVLFRAIRDGGSTCPQLTGFERIAPVAGRPAWNATCSDRGRWRVILSDDGTASVTGSSPR